MTLRSPIKADAVDNAFNDQFMDGLRRYLPRVKNMTHFTQGVRSAARRYAQSARTPSGDEVRAEIRDLFKLANFKKSTTKRTTGKKYEKIARKLERLSEPARELLTTRAARISRASEPSGAATAMGRDGEILTRKGRGLSTVALPEPEDLRNCSRRDRACEIITSLCLTGARIGEREIEFDLYAPQVIYEGGIRKRRPKTKAELEFVGALRLIWLEATEDRAARTGNARDPGPFVRFVAVCLQQVGAYNESASYAAAARLISELERRSKEFEKRPRADWKKEVDTL
jgi:hypothetical protein